MEPVQLGRLPLVQSNSPGCKAGMSWDVDPKLRSNQFWSIHPVISIYKSCLGQSWSTPTPHPETKIFMKEFYRVSKKCFSFHLMSKYLRISSNPYVSMHHLHNSHWNIMTLLSYTIASRCIKLRSQTCCQVAWLVSAGEWPSCASTNHHGILISVALQHHAVTLDLIFAAFPSHQSDCNCLSENRVQLRCAQHKIRCTTAIFCNALHQAVGNAPAKAHLKRIGSSLWHTCFLIFSCVWFSRIFNLSL